MRGCSWKELLDISQDGYTSTTGVIRFSQVLPLTTKLSRREILHAGSVTCQHHGRCTIQTQVGHQASLKY